MLAGVILLYVPDPDPELPSAQRRSPFVWNQDAYWASLEASFREARSADCGHHAGRIRAKLHALDVQLASVNTRESRADDPVFSLLEQRLFELAPLVGVCFEHLPAFMERARQVRSALKRQSLGWDMNDPLVRSRMYRLLYGSRAAVEEVLLQAPPDLVPELDRGGEEPSATPSAAVLGLTLHSGDVLISRGGAPTSALIARGNDYPGNFSHVALVHIDEATHEVSILESHIERGVTISSVDEYVKDVKLRILVLRLRHDLPILRNDPLLPHRAASEFLEEARRRHIPYDFAMDFREPSAMFCSEVASAAYAREGITLWMGVSSISGPGIMSWLGALGVRNFETQEPSDLEYDPQLSVVAEWRDPETLFKDHIDNAVIDVMLEEAEGGRRMEYVWLLLPAARAAKAYSAVLNILGGVGPIPEGMRATAALKVRWFSGRHESGAAQLRARAKEFQDETGYRPPYWELVRLARELSF